MPEVQGACSPRFAAVREAFEKSFGAGEEVAAAHAAARHRAAARRVRSDAGSR